MELTLRKKAGEKRKEFKIEFSGPKAKEGHFQINRGFRDIIGVKRGTENISQELIGTTIY